MKIWLFMFMPLALSYLIIYANAQVRDEAGYGDPYPPIGRHRYLLRWILFCRTSSNPQRQSLKKQWKDMPFCVQSRSDCISTDNHWFIPLASLAR
jgi:hypothetical protein